MMNINNEFDYEDSETIERIKVSNKLLKKNRLLLGDNDSRIILSEGANTYEYKY